MSRLRTNFKNMSRTILSTLSITLILGLMAASSSKDRVMIFENQEVKTTFNVDKKFLGKYAGSKGGYLQLNEEGTGEYLYDYFGYAKEDCKKGSIRIEWGFIYDHKGEILYFDREYGLSYPVIFKAMGNTSFQGCTKNMIVDYLLVYDKDGKISVSSSSDWEKK